QENLGVQKEFATLSDDANVYKLVGPVLLKQDTSEARSTVDGRLEFIEKEMYVAVDPKKAERRSIRSCLAAG
ncbi:Prefoldin subunit 6, partial [Cryomyces antarcticus]